MLDDPSLGCKDRKRTVADNRIINEDALQPNQAAPTIRGPFRATAGHGEKCAWRAILFLSTTPIVLIIFKPKMRLSAP